MIKRGVGRSAIVISAIVTAALCRVPSGLANGPRHFNEGKLAGLRPGRASIERAYRRFGKNHVDPVLSSAKSPVWIDNCNHEQVTVHADSMGVINEITVAPARWVIDADCELKAYNRAARAFGTGHGLLFNDNCNRAEELYGTPQSDSTVEENRQALRVMRFSGLAGSRQALALEVACGIASGRVRQMILTASASSAGQ